MKQLLPHIEIGTHESGRIILIIEDYELFDFLDDYLTDECDIPYEYRSSQQRQGGEIITMYFPLSTNSMEIEQSLTKLSAQKIKDIYLLNNKPK